MGFNGMWNTQSFVNEASDRKIYEKVIETIARSYPAIFFAERFPFAFREYVLATFLICVCALGKKRNNKRKERYNT